VDLRRLEVFVKMMATRSFSKTADELGLTQPTVSGHIKTLEEEIELRLFDRHRRQVLPTSAAFVLLDYAQKILELRTETLYALEQFQGRMTGRLRLGGSTIPGGYILPVLIGQFRRIYPGVSLKLLLGDTQGILYRIIEGDVEVGMVGAKMTLDDLEYEPLIEDEMVLAVPLEHPWAEPGIKIGVADLPAAPFIIREEGSGTRAAMLASLQKMGLGVGDLDVVAEMGSTEAVLQGIRSGLGVSILSRIALSPEIKCNQIKTVPVEGLNLRRPFYLVTHRKRSRSPLCTAFLEFLRQEGRKSAATLTEAI